MSGDSTCELFYRSLFKWLSFLWSVLCLSVSTAALCIFCYGPQMHTTHKNERTCHGPVTGVYQVWYWSISAELNITALCAGISLIKRFLKIISTNIHNHHSNSGHGHDVLPTRTKSVKNASVSITALHFCSAVFSVLGAKLNSSSFQSKTKMKPCCRAGGRGWQNVLELSFQWSISVASFQ